MNSGLDLTQHTECPACGWEHRAVDAADGLHAINRRCQRNDCRTYFVAVFRGTRMVGTAQLGGRTVDEYETALKEVEDLSRSERQRLVLGAHERSMAQYQGNGGSR